jgi:hypothetical protein
MLQPSVAALAGQFTPSAGDKFGISKENCNRNTLTAFRTPQKTVNTTVNPNCKNCTNFWEL